MRSIRHNYNNLYFIEIIKKYNPIDENHNVKPNNPYMSSKWIAEQLCTNICQQLNIPLTVFRTFNIYGAGLKKGRLISDLLHNIMNNEDLLLNDPSPIRDYLYIEDFINLIFYLLDSKKSSEGIFNIGSGESHSNLEVAQTIQTLTSPFILRRKKIDVAKNLPPKIYSDRPL